MQYPIFVQNPAESHFTASVIGMPTCVAEGQTEAEALAKAESLLDEQLAKSKIFMVDKPSTTQLGVNPSSGLLPKRKKGDFSTLPGYGIFKDDPTFDDFVERMAEFRAEFDAEAAE
jgi:predicted RNase H-like HicB family nuclease